MKTEFKGLEPETMRELLLYNVEKIANFPNRFDTVGPHFVCALALDARNIPDTDITELSRKLIDAGCAYLCCWGDDCERVHDLFDSEWIKNGFDETTDDTIMTTWHNKDSLEGCVSFAIAHAIPTPGFVGGCKSVVAVVFDDEDHESRISKILADPSQTLA